MISSFKSDMFLEIVFVWHLFVCLCVCVSVCLPPRLLITSGMVWHDIKTL